LSLSTRFGFLEEHPLEGRCKSSRRKSQIKN
jgi:hypothetical protein